MLGDDAFQSHRAGVLQKFVAVRLDVDRHADDAVRMLNNILEYLPTFRLAQAGQVMAVEVKQVEGVKHRCICRFPTAPAPERRLQRPEIRSAFRVEDDCLPVNDGRIRKFPRCYGNSGKAVGPVVAAARDHPHPVRFDMDRQPVTVPLHLVAPVRASRHLGHEKSKARLDTSRHRIEG